MAGTTAATSAAAAAAVANAIKASGAIVRVAPHDFLEILARCEAPLVVQTSGKTFFTLHYQYMTSYRGFIFHTKTPKPIDIPEWCETVAAKSVWVPQ